MNSEVSPLDELQQDDDRRIAQFCRWLARQPDLATALRELRAVRGMSLREAAFHAHRSAPYLDRIEHGLRRPERDTLIALCLRAYDLTVRETGCVLLLAEYAPMRHEQLAFMPPVSHATGMPPPALTRDDQIKWRYARRTQ